MQLWWLHPSSETKRRRLRESLSVGLCKEPFREDGGCNGGSSEDKTEQAGNARCVVSAGTFRYSVTTLSDCA